MRRNLGAVLCKAPLLHLFGILGESINFLLFDLFDAVVEFALRLVFVFFPFTPGILEWSLVTSV
jgi:hypothetical protein